MWIKIIFLSFNYSKSCHLLEYTRKWFGVIYDARSEIFPLSNKFLFEYFCLIF